MIPAHQGPSTAPTSALPAITALKMMINKPQKQIMTPNTRAAIAWPLAIVPILFFIER